MIPTIVKPKGKITSIDASTITAAYGSVVNGTQKLRSLEIFRASVVKIDNQSDTPICARVVAVSQLEASTGLTYSHSYTIDTEVGNYMDVIIKPADTVYIRKRSGNTIIDIPPCKRGRSTARAPQETVERSHCWLEAASLAV